MKSTRSVLVAGGIAAVLLLAGCAGADNSTAGESEACPDGITDVKIAWIPITAMAAVQAAMDEGIFAENCLEVEPVEIVAGQSIVAAMQAGQVQFVSTNVGSAAAASQQGLDVLAVAPWQLGSTSNGIYATAESGITSLADLAGKKVALGSIESSTHAGFIEQLEAAGVDASEVEVSLVDVPQLLDALTSGQYDAAQLVEPFITIGGEDVVALAEDITAPFGEDAPVGLWLTTHAYNDEHPEVVEAFSTSLDEAVELINSDNDALISAMVNAAGIDEELASAINAPRFGTEIDADAIQAQLVAMTELGFFEEEPDTTALLTK